MRSREPKPPRFNRYNVYLIVGLALLAPLFASRGIERGCRFERMFTDLSTHCVGLDAWRWFLSSGGNWEAWVFCATILIVILALIYQSFK
jgi:hypothetical protein